MSTTFFCNFSVPILVAEDRYKYVPVVGVFRSIPVDQIDKWVMHPGGGPRSDRELASEVLVEVRKPLGTSGRTVPHSFEVADVLHLDRAAAIVVSTFLAALPRA
ncbi:hypothetical protein ASC78_19365 [Variovorax sp. Root318D1]|uniref:hypothetical protein n=1 Tax=Variovorax sp. Root318D1 TaxID=1736513 RepID=UPI0006F8755D|nr:hypothetical protein [Variovorax sp. Root318D1]KQU91134.1 hypothetical protein ASC78_19365 [Variovorax sp. Root318D1]